MAELRGPGDPSGFQASEPIIPNVESDLEAKENEMKIKEALGKLDQTLQSEWSKFVPTADKYIDELYEALNNPDWDEWKKKDKTEQYSTFIGALLAELHKYNPERFEQELRQITEKNWGRITQVPEDSYYMTEHLRSLKVLSQDQYFQLIEKLKNTDDESGGDRTQYQELLHEIIDDSSLYIAPGIYNLETLVSLEDIDPEKYKKNLPYENDSLGTIRGDFKELSPEKVDKITLPVKILLKVFIPDVQLDIAEVLTEASENPDKYRLINLLEAYNYANRFMEYLSSGKSPVVEAGIERREAEQEAKRKMAEQEEAEWQAMTKEQRRETLRKGIKEVRVVIEEFNKKQSSPLEEDLKDILKSIGKESDVVNHSVRIAEEAGSKLDQWLEMLDQPEADLDEIRSEFLKFNVEGEE